MLITKNKLRKLIQESITRVLIESENKRNEKETAQEAFKRLIKYGFEGLEAIHVPGLNSLKKILEGSGLKLEDNSEFKFKEIFADIKALLKQRKDLTEDELKLEIIKIVKKHNEGLLEEGEDQLRRFLIIAALLVVPGGPFAAVLTGIGSGITANSFKELVGKELNKKLFFEEIKITRPDLYNMLTREPEEKTFKDDDDLDTVLAKTSRAPTSAADTWR